MRNQKVEKQYQTQSILFSILMTTIVMIIFITIEYFEFKSLTDREYKNLNQEIRKIFNFEINRANKFYMARIESNIGSYGVKDALKRGDRQALYDLVLPRFKVLQKENPYLKNMHFHSADGISVVRMHQPDKFGDNIGEKRELLKYVRKDHKNIYGFEDGIYGIFYRIIRPIFDDNGEYIGSVELGLSLDYFEHFTKELCPELDVAILLDKDDVSLYRDKENLYSFKNFYILSSKDIKIAKALEKHDFLKSFSIIDQNSKKYMLLSSIFINTFNGEKSVQLVALKDISDIEEYFYKYLFMIFIFVIFFYIFFIIIVKMSLRNYSKKVYRLNNKLYKAHSKLDTIFNTTPDGIAILNMDLQFVNINPAYTTITGYSLKELEGLTCLDITAPEDYEFARTALNRVISNGFVEKYYKNCINKNGHRVHVSVSLSLFPDRNGILISTRDITKKKKLEDRLERYVEIVDKNVITSTTDLDGNITDVSDAFCQVSGYRKDELIGRYHNIVKHPSVKEPFYRDMWDTITDNRVWSGEIKNINKNRETYWVFATIYPLYDWRGEKIGYTAIRQDITDKKRVEELSIRDELTKLYNRRHFNDVIEREIKRARRDQHYLSFMILDVDFFKQYNDTYGHQAGDTVLKQVAEVLQSSLKRGSDFAFRLGGEEFGIVFSDLDMSKSLEFAEIVRDRVHKLEIEHKNSKIDKFVTTSVGLFIAKGTDIVDEDSIFRLADDALYRAKESGRNRTCISDEN